VPRLVISRQSPGGGPLEDKNKTTIDEFIEYLGAQK
jgi:hypothetical protein